MQQGRSKYFWLALENAEPGTTDWCYLPKQTDLIRNPQLLQEGMNMKVFPERTWSISMEWNRHYLYISFAFSSFQGPSGALTWQYLSSQASFSICIYSGFLWVQRPFFFFFFTKVQLQKNWLCIRLEMFTFLTGMLGRSIYGEMQLLH